MAVLFVDESGNEGFTKGSSDWFVLGGALVPDAAIEDMNSSYQSFTERFRKPVNWHFHFQTAKHDTRLAFLKTARESGIRAHAVAIHKPSITKTENFSKKYWLYFTALIYLLENVTSHCAAHNQVVTLHLSSRKGLSPDNFNEYVAKRKSSPFVKIDKMKWDFLDLAKTQIHQSRDIPGLQFADCVASSLFKAIQTSEYDTIEPRYIAELSSCFLHDGRGYDKNIKIWPREAKSSFFQSHFSPAYKMGRKIGG